MSFLLTSWLLWEPFFSYTLLFVKVQLFLAKQRFDDDANRKEEKYINTEGKRPFTVVDAAIYFHLCLGLVILTF